MSLKPIYAGLTDVYSRSGKSLLLRGVEVANFTSEAITERAVLSMNFCAGVHADDVWPLLQQGGLAGLIEQAEDKA
jgi:hypothetical protein